LLEEKLEVKKNQTEAMAMIDRINGERHRRRNLKLSVTTADEMG
jgi:hypothetical protein